MPCFFKIMKKISLLLLSVVLIIYPIYAIFRCIAVFGSLSNYGKGVLFGGVALFIIGLLLLLYAIRLFKQSK